jgi:hypothetical protein
MQCTRIRALASWLSRSGLQTPSLASSQKIYTVEQTERDKRVFTTDWKLQPGWEVHTVGAGTKRGWEWMFVDRKDGEMHYDVGLLRLRKLYFNC